MPRIYILERCLECSEGELLIDILKRHGISLCAPCGGRGVCGKCKVTVNGRSELACNYRVTGDVTVSLPECTEGLQSSNDAVIPRENTCFALDIGTTSQALALWDTESGRILRTVTFENPQRVYGADVISRIEYCRQGGTHRMFTVLRDAISKMTASFALGGKRELYVSGNTVMLHLFLDTDCSGIGTFPYTPTFTDSLRLDGESLGLDGISSVVTLPCISAFVGADITAGLACMAPPPPGKYAMLVDLGTNAEIVLFSRERTVCTSAAAGPCFEGANISCGITASSGAICSFSIGEDGEGICRTVDGAPPVGICGTGLIDIVAELLSHGMIDRDGTLSCGNYRVAPGIYLTQEDIRELQLAKSAVRSAITVLMKKEGVSERDISEMCLSGGFASGIDLKNAVKLGLIPYKLAQKCRTEANTSLMGTVACARAFRRDGVMPSSPLAEYVDLSADEYFSELFIENMRF